MMIIKQNNRTKIKSWKQALLIATPIVFSFHIYDGFAMEYNQEKRNLNMMSREKILFRGGESSALDDLKQKSLHVVLRFVKGNIDSREILGSTLHDVEGRGKCVYDAAVHQSVVSERYCQVEKNINTLNEYAANKLPSLKQISMKSSAHQEEGGRFITQMEGLANLATPLSDALAWEKLGDFKTENHIYFRLKNPRQWPIKGFWAIKGEPSEKLSDEALRVLLNPGTKITCKADYNTFIGIDLSYNEDNIPEYPTYQKDDIFTLSNLRDELRSREVKYSKRLKILYEHTQKLYEYPPEDGKLDSFLLQILYNSYKLVPPFIATQFIEQLSLSEFRSSF